MTSERPTSTFFRARVAAISDLTPSFRRFTFVGDDLDRYGDPGFDQRVKIVFPTAHAPLSAMPTTADWYERWRTLPTETRPIFRTYTTRAVRNDRREVDIDMVVHDVAGPASRWISTAQVGDDVLIFAPTTDHTGVSYGVDFVPPARTDSILLVGDETAAPAIAVILEQLPRDARGVVVVELPVDADHDYLPTHPGFEMHVSARGDTQERSAQLVAAGRAAALRLAPAGRGGMVEEIDVDDGILWEVPRTAKGGAALKSAPLYSWMAGESAAIKTLRRHLVADLGVDRRAVAFMGYWRLGRSEY